MRGREKGKLGALKGYVKGKDRRPKREKEKVGGIIWHGIPLGNQAARTPARTNGTKRSWTHPRTSGFLALCWPILVWRPCKRAHWGVLTEKFPRWPVAVHMHEALSQSWPQQFMVHFARWKVANAVEQMPAPPQ